MKLKKCHNGGRRDSTQRKKCRKKILSCRNMNRRRSRNDKQLYILQSNLRVKFIYNLLRIRQETAEKHTGA